MPRAGVQTPTSMRASEDFPDAVGPITPSALPAASVKLTSWQTIFCWPGGDNGRVLHHERARRRLERHRFGRGRQVAEQSRQPLPALPRADKAAPIGDRQIDRSERARAEDRAGDDDARRRFLIDHEPGADRQNCGLQQQPQHLRKCAQSAADVAGAPARLHVIAVEVVPAFGDAADHAHRRDRLGIAPARFQKRVARHGELGGAAGRTPGLYLGHHGQRDEDDGAEQRGEADIGVEQETDGEIDRHPRQIEEGNGPAAGQKAAHRIEIADRLGAVAFGADFERQPHDRVIDPQTHAFRRGCARRAPGCGS